MYAIHQADLTKQMRYLDDTSLGREVFEFIPSCFRLSACYTVCAKTLVLNPNTIAPRARILND